ncbi:hypothetical protein [Bacillus sp. CECT 9360]|uniref:hypothetical protein n=1 Tax=Bacillus sp. CECT 9360 TaxID=2845821 RepID=UPI001E346879|nr:hypothetical protein [Bacillus sp. CECT 9360]CAH0345413.1 hypothetical protein BCI9360_01699 [Bacillus sp. CECT 9360]
MADKDKVTNVDHAKKNEDTAAVNVENSSANRKQNPEIGSRGRGPIIINDSDATMLNRGIFENTHREYYDGDEYR